MEQTPGNLSLIGNDVWKGGATHNGTLLKLHTNDFTTGYSTLTSHPTIATKFGSGVWYDAAMRNNKVYSVMPTGPGKEPVFAGILTRQPAIASGYPVSNDTLNAYNKGLIAKEGFVIYKTATETLPEDQVFSDIKVGMYLLISQTTGRQFFSASNVVSGYTLAGVVISMNPDDSSWTVCVSSTLENATAVTVGAVATLISNAITASIAPAGAVQLDITANITAECAPTGIIGLAIAAAIAAIP